MTVFSRHPVDTPNITFGFGAGGDKWGSNKHLGVDYAEDVGAPVYAPAAGTVVRASDQGSPMGNPWEQIPGSLNNGNHVIIRHDAPHTATHTLYAHLSSFTVSEGQHVNAGDLIGYVGNTGYSFGSHLHWEMFIDYSEGQYPEGTFYGRVNPLDYFKVVTHIPVAPGAGGASATPEEEDEDMALTNEDIDKIADRVLTKVVKDKKGQGQNSLAWVLTSQRASRDEDRRLIAASIKSAVDTIVAAIKGTK